MTESKSREGRTADAISKAPRSPERTSVVVGYGLGIGAVTLVWAVPYLVVATDADLSWHQIWLPPTIGVLLMFCPLVSGIGAISFGLLAQDRKVAALQFAGFALAFAIVLCLIAFVSVTYLAAFFVAFAFVIGMPASLIAIPATHRGGWRPNRPAVVGIVALAMWPVLFITGIVIPPPGFG